MRKNCYDNKKRIREDKGAITIEASLALTTFLFVFLVIYSFIAICRAQARMQVALNNSAQEISKFSYLYGLSGLDESLKKFQDSAGGTKDQVNGFVGDTIGVFNAMQNVGGTVSSVDTSSVDGLMNSWGNISSELQSAGSDFAKVKADIESMASDPKNFLLGMARLIGSESLELAKSRAIAEPVCRALMQKHLKRTNDDTADDFCKSVGIIEGTYLGSQSYFNGIDFSNSTLFAYGSDEIKLIATYKIKLLQLLPIDTEFTITQGAVTKGWLHGDKSTIPASEEIQNAAASSNPEETIWNTKSPSDRQKIIRSAELDILKANGYYSVSGSNTINAYNPDTNTVAFVTSWNATYDKEISDLDREQVKATFKEYADKMIVDSNHQTIKIKEPDEKGNITTREVNVAGTEINKKVVIVIPEDPELKAYVEEIIKEIGYDGVYEIKSEYGTGKKLND